MIILFVLGLGLIRERDMSDKDDERLWNLVVYNIYATDQERDDLFVWLGPVLLVLIILGCVAYGIYKLLPNSVG